MSRIQIPAQCVKNPAHDVWVGWDSPLESYFGQVYDREIQASTDPDDERDPVIFWCGASSVGEIKTVSELDSVMRDYCTIPETIAAELLDDYANRSTPSPLQVWGRSIGGPDYVVRDGKTYDAYSGQEIEL